ncbi:MAG TPA: hypothetical protein VFQ25_00025 [Ktedonobacterales bacterium]|nr:hypothetical protein [Ktedonobacterales bacterium]
MMTDGNGRKPGAGGEDQESEIEDLDNEEYDMMALLDELESLEEEMEELGVTTLDEVRQRIRDLHDRLGE